MQSTTGNQTSLGMMDIISVVSMFEHKKADFLFFFPARFAFDLIEKKNNGIWKKTQ